MSIRPLARWQRFAWVLAPLAGLWLTSAAAAQQRTFEQQPEVVAAQVRNQPAPSQPAQPSGASQALRQGPTPKWIWGADPNRSYVLRKVFSANADQAVLKAACDNVMTVRLNGRQVAAGSEWQQPVEADIRKHLKPGENELTVEVSNQGGPSGFVLKLALLGKDGKAQYVVSDETWTAAESADASESQPVKVIAALGSQPWGDVFAAPAAPVGGTPRDVFLVPEGFQVERLFTVPKDQLGSWVCITFDSKGRLLASDQGNQGLCRITPPPIGSDQPTRVEHLPVKMSAAQGMLCAFDSLYVSVNGGPGSGFYRLRDTDGDDQYDQVEKLKAFQGGGEHGPHALRLAPDGKSIYVIAGNHTRPPQDFDSSRVPRNWDEDLLLPRQWDANGHARGVLAPGGWIARTDPDGKTWEMVSIGYRNPYDMAFNADGELFAYDADMEWDMGAPWYRPTRVSHATSGSEFGWRSGTGKWPPYYIDSLPAAVDIGPGSPVGVEFGYGTKFPARYQKALFICDWTFGTMYAVHFQPQGATYTATKEEFVARTPLPLTDCAVGPDGALYFTIGGRGTQSELFRVTYVGKEPTSPADARDRQFAAQRELRGQIEQYHQPAENPAKAVAFVWPHLKHEDRFIRYAARVALEHQDLSVWQSRALAEEDSVTLIHAAVALARQGDPALLPQLLAALDRIDYAGLRVEHRLGLLRAWQLAFIRLGQPDENTAAALAGKLDRFYPAKTNEENRELVQLLVYLNSPTVVGKTIALMQQPSPPPTDEEISQLLARNPGYGGAIRAMLANQPDLQKLHYAFVLRNARQGWTIDQRRYYFQWLQETRGKSGGASFQGFLNNIDREAFDNCTDAERLAVEATGARKPYQVPELPKPAGPGREYTLEDLLALGSARLKGRNYKNGQKMYAAARCVVCHRFNGEGGATGPDLTQVAGRFNLKDLSEAIVDPSKVISDQYRAHVIETAGGQVITGRVVTETGDTLVVVTDPENSTKVIEVPKGEVEQMAPSKVSLMPKDLLKQLNEDEVLDLLAYLLSRGDPNDPLFRK